MAERKNEPDLVSYISYNDIEIIKNRIPKEYKTRLRDIFIHHKSYGVRVLGSVRKRGRRDIDLNSMLPYPVHNSPKSDEISVIKLWQKLNKIQRFELVELSLNAPYKEMPNLNKFGIVNETQEKFLLRALSY